MTGLAARLRRRLAGGAEDGMALVLVLLIGALTMILLATASAALVGQIGPTKSSVDAGAAQAAAEAGLEDFVAAANANCNSVHGFTCSWLTTGRASGTVADPRNDPGTPVCPVADAAHCPAKPTERFYWRVTTQVTGSARVMSVGQVPTGKTSPKFRTTTVYADVQATPGFNDFQYYTKYETLPTDFLSSFYGARTIEMTAGSDRSNSQLSGSSAAGTLRWSGACTYVDATTTPTCDPNHDLSICNDLYYATGAGAGRGTDSAWNNAVRRPGLAIRQALGTDDTAGSGRTFAYYNENGVFAPSTGSSLAVTHNDVCDSTFEPNMIMNGPIFSQDAYLIDRGKDTGVSKNSMPNFNDYAYTAWTGSLNGAQQPVGPNGGQIRAYPNTNGEIATALPQQPVYTSNPFALPANADGSKSLVTCTYTGPTRIKIVQNIAYITSPGTPTSPTPPGASYCYTSTGPFQTVVGGGVVNAQVPISKTVIYVKKPTSGAPAVASATNKIFDLKATVSAPPATSSSTLVGTWDTSSYTATQTCPSPANVIKRRNFDCETSKTTPPSDMATSIATSVNSSMRAGAATPTAMQANLTAAITNLIKTSALSAPSPFNTTQGSYYKVTVATPTATSTTTSAPAMSPADPFFQTGGSGSFTTTTMTARIDIDRITCAAMGNGSNRNTCNSNATKSIYAGTATGSTSSGTAASATAGFPWAGAQTGTTTYTDANNDVSRYRTGEGTAYVEGTLHGQMSVVAERDVLVTNDLLYSNANLATTADGLALVANHDVRVYRPMTCTDNGAVGTTTSGYCPNDLSGVYTQPQSFPLPNNFPSAKYTANAAPSMTHDGSGQIYATIFTLRGCFMTDNFYRGTVGQGITINGGLYQDHRGPTSLPYQGRPYQGSTSKMPGVVLTYNYDNLRAGQTANGGLRVPWIPNPQGRPSGSNRTWNVTSISSGS